MTIGRERTISFSRSSHGSETTLTDETELNACRWLVESFCVDGFASLRHACADVCMSVHQISHARSRELHDLSALEVRRVLFDDLKHREQIVAGRLLGTRAAWMAQYSPLLTPSEFTRFYVLMKNLAPYLLLLIVDPAKNGSHRRDRNPTIGRKNLELVLNGDAAGIPLFELEHAVHERASRSWTSSLGRNLCARDCQSGGVGSPRAHTFLTRFRLAPLPPHF